MEERDRQTLSALEFAMKIQHTTLEDNENALIEELRLVQDKRATIAKWLNATRDMLE